MRRFRIEQFVLLIISKISFPGSENTFLHNMLVYQQIKFIVGRCLERFSKHVYDCVLVTHSFLDILHFFQLFIVDHHTTHCIKFCNFRNFHLPKSKWSSRSTHVKSSSLTETCWYLFIECRASIKKHSNKKCGCFCLSVRFGIWPWE